MLQSLDAAAGPQLPNFVLWLALPAKCSCVHLASEIQVPIAVTIYTFKIEDFNPESELLERLLSINEGTAPSAAMRAKNKINLLKEDGTSGVFHDERGQNVIQFPGKRDEATPT